MRPNFAAATTNTILMTASTQAIHLYSALNLKLNLHQLNLPNLKPNWHCAINDQRFASRPPLFLLDCLQKRSGVPRQRDLHHRHVSVALVEQRQRSPAELRVRVPHAYMAPTLVVYSDLLVRVRGRDVDVEGHCQGSVNGAVEVGDAHAVYVVLGDLGVVKDEEYSDKDAGDSEEEEEEEEEE
ncbi:hypothetical protein Nepgr_021833 [Nepenthes gracilis]|uniref:Uncharacterized protein n=1 Tax=Nepenthes gracilis TaxID=150966 RepID=A0AAD3XW93_NEPGR|nr:hypothetical protein Nepgr_021833 [Nepenthes gracilis]